MNIKTLIAIAVCAGTLFGAPTTKEILALCNGSKNSYDEKETQEILESKKFIGEGGFGKVYSFIDKNGKELAIKELDSKSEKENLEIYRELNALIDLKDIDGVPKIHKCLFKDKKFYVLMTKYYKDLYDKKVIEDFAEKPFDKILTILKETTSMVQKIHAKKYIHGDIKPQNMMFLDDKLEKIGLVDFGLTREITDYFKAGSPMTFSPELIFTDNFRQIKNDIWALGVTYGVLLFGKSFLTEKKYAKKVTNCCFPMK
jgi:serine/threonine protein kinase